ncbi:MAG: FtsQ-type POTRA domain-containing protein, partial [Elusimicrobiota bacterium]
MASTDIFDLKPSNVVISGNRMVSENEILTGLDLDYGKNIFSYSLAELEKKLKKKKKIKKARLKRNFPDSLHVRVFEVNPVGYAVIEGERNVVSEEGVFFKGSQGPPVEFIPRSP